MRANLPHLLQYSKQNYNSKEDDDDDDDGEMEELQNIDSSPQYSLSAVSTALRALPAPGLIPVLTWQPRYKRIDVSNQASKAANHLAPIYQASD